MYLNRLYNTLLRYIWMVVILAVLGGGTAAYISVYKTVPMYRSESTLYVLKRGSSLESSDITISRQLAQDYSEIIKSRRVSEEAVRRLSNIGVSESELNSVVRVSTQRDSIFFTISAIWTDPETAALISNTMSRVLAEKVNELTDSYTIGILDEAQVPLVPVSNNLVRKILAGILAGLLIGFGIIYLVTFYDNTIREAEDIQNELKLDVVGIIPKHSIK